MCVEQLRGFVVSNQRTVQRMVSSLIGPLVINDLSENSEFLEQAPDTLTRPFSELPQDHRVSFLAPQIIRRTALHKVKVVRKIFEKAADNKETEEG